MKTPSITCLSAGAISGVVIVTTGLWWVGALLIVTSAIAYQEGCSRGNPHA